MKKVKNGKVYDTETAEVVGCFESGKPGDMYHFAEELYRKRTGEFFLYGYGGPASKYGVPIGDCNWSGSDEIIPISYPAAQKWAEEHLTGDEYEEIFGLSEEKEGKAVVYLYLPARKVDEYKQAAAKSGTSLTAYIEGLLEKAEKMGNE